MILHFAPQGGSIDTEFLGSLAPMPVVSPQYVHNPVLLISGALPKHTLMTLPKALRMVPSGIMGPIPLDFTS